MAPFMKKSSTAVAQHGSLRGDAASRVAGPGSESQAERAHRLSLIERMTFEVVPMKSLDSATAALPAGAEVSVTCSPVKGIEETQRVTENLLTRGFTPIPHISARMVRDESHVEELAAWLQANGLRKIFVVGGDAEVPGAYPDAVLFLEALMRTDHGLDTVGVTAYPDGHAFISDQDLTNALFAKQQILTAAGVQAYCSTQMCFDPVRISQWMRAQRTYGLTMPIHLGISGVVDKARLMKMGVRLGIGQSLGFLRKNKTAVLKMMTSSSYDLNDLLVPLSQDLLGLGVESLHVFTFNQVEATNQWRVTEIT